MIQRHDTSFLTTGKFVALSVSMGKEHSKCCHAEEECVGIILKEIKVKACRKEHEK